MSDDENDENYVPDGDNYKRCRPESHASSSASSSVSSSTNLGLYFAHFVYNGFNLFDNDSWSSSESMALDRGVPKIVWYIIYVFITAPIKTIKLIVDRMGIAYTRELEKYLRTSNEQSMFHALLSSDLSPRVNEPIRSPDGHGPLSSSMLVRILAGWDLAGFRFEALRDKCRGVDWIVEELLKLSNDAKLTMRPYVEGMYQRLFSFSKQPVTILNDVTKLVVLVNGDRGTVTNRKQMPVDSLAFMRLCPTSLSASYQVQGDMVLHRRHLLQQPVSKVSTKRRTAAQALAFDMWGTDDSHLQEYANCTQQTQPDLFFREHMNVPLPEDSEIHDFLHDYIEYQLFSDDGRNKGRFHFLVQLLLRRKNYRHDNPGRYNQYI